MGLFLGISSVVGQPLEATIDSLRRFATVNEGYLTTQDNPVDQDDTLIAASDQSGTTILYPYHYLDWQRASQHLSRDLDTPVLSFNIHDGDLWMYVLYDRGEEADRFNPIPDYWGDLDESERELWKGNPSSVAQRIPGVDPRELEPYLCLWSDDMFEAYPAVKAHPDDEYGYAQDWQLLDFMKRLGFRYPVDKSGIPLGRTFNFKTKTEY